MSNIKNEVNLVRPPPQKKIMLVGYSSGSNNANHTRVIYYNFGSTWSSHSFHCFDFSVLALSTIDGIYVTDIYLLVLYVCYQLFGLINCVSVVGTFLRILCSGEGGIHALIGREKCFGIQITRSFHGSINPPTSINYFPIPSQFLVFLITSCLCEHFCCHRWWNEAQTL